MGKGINIKELRNTRAYDERMLYSSTISMLREAYGIIENIDKFSRECFGIQFIKKITSVIHIYKNAYKNDCIEVKVRLLQNIIKTLDTIGTDLRVLKELKIITDKQYGNIIMRYGPIMSQTINFINSLEKVKQK